MTKLEKEAEEKYCKGCKWRIEQCLWAWRKTNGLKEPNEKNCSCKEVPAYLAGAEPREKQIQIDAEQIRALQKQNGELNDKVKELEAEVREWKDKADLWCKTANLKDHNIMINKELEKENAELKSENQKWKDEWQEQVQKATDEGYARTLQTIQLTKATKIIKKLYAVYYAPCVTESDLKYRDELFAEIKQFLSEVEKC